MENILGLCVLAGIILGISTAIKECKHFDKVIENNRKRKNKIDLDIENNNTIIDSNNVLDINYSMYYKRKYILTETELRFYRQLKIITDKMGLTIFPEVNLERIINVKNQNPTFRNRIKSRSIDFTIVNSKNCEIICCIELDDYTHNRLDRQARDIFINELYKNTGLKLLRVKVAKEYDFNKIENSILELIEYKV